MEDFLINSTRILFIVDILEQDEEVISRWADISNDLLAGNSARKRELEKQLKDSVPFSQYGKATFENFLILEKEPNFKPLITYLTDKGLENAADALEKFRQKIGRLGLLNPIEKYAEKDDRIKALESENDIQIVDDPDDPLYNLFKALEKYDALKAELGPEHSDAISARCEIAAIFEERGDFVEARSIYGTLAREKEAILGPDDLETLVLTHKAFRIAYHQGNIQGALALEVTRNLYNAQIEKYGKDHEDIPKTRELLREMLQKYQEEEAEKLKKKEEGTTETLEELVKRQGGIPIKKNPFEAIDSAREIYACLKIIHDSDSQELLDKEKELLQMVDKMEDELFVITKSNAEKEDVGARLFAFLEKQTQVEKTLSERAQVYDIVSTSNSDPNSLIIAGSKILINRLLDERSRIEAQIRAIRRSQKITVGLPENEIRATILDVFRTTRRVANTKNPVIVELRNILIEILFQPKIGWGWEEGVEKYKRIFEVRREIFKDEEDVEYVSRTMVPNFALLLELKSGEQEALEFNKLTKKDFNEDSKDSHVLEILQSIAILTHQTDEKVTDESISQYKSLLEDLEQTNPSAAMIIKYNIAIALLEQEKYDEALEALTELVEAQTKHFGEKSREALRTELTKLAILAKNGDQEETIEKFKVIVQSEPTNSSPEVWQYDIFTVLPRLLIELNKTDEIAAKIIILLRVLVEIQTNLLGKTDPLVLEMKELLARGLEVEKADSEVFEIFKEIYQTRKRDLGSLHPITLKTGYLFAAMYEEVKEYEDCLKILIELFEVSRAALGDEHPAILTARFDIAQVMGRAGMLEESTKILQNVYEVRKRVLGETDKDTLKNQMDLALNLVELEKKDDGLKLLTEMLETCTKALGLEAELTLQVRIILAQVLRNMGDKEKDEALAIYKEVHEIRTRLLGENDDGTLDVLKAIGLTLCVMGKNQDALNILKELLSLQIAKSGEEHASILSTKRLIANVFIVMGQMEEGVNTFMEILQVEQRILGQDNETTCQTKLDIAKLLRKLRRTNEAVALVMEVHEVRSRTLGEIHQQTTGLLVECSNAYRKAGQWDEAVAILEKCHEVKNRILGPEDSATLGTKIFIGWLFREMGRLDEALANFKEVYEIRARLLGDIDEDTLSAQSMIVDVLILKGHYKEADELFNQVLKIQIDTLGEEHSTTMETKHGMALLLLEMGLLNIAMTLTQNVYEIYKRDLGEEHDSTRTARHNVANLMMELGHLDEALEILREHEKLESGIEKLKRGKLPEGSTLFTIAEILDKKPSKEERNEALRMFREIYEVQAKLLPPNNRELLLTKYTIAVNLSQKGEIQESQKILEEVLSVRRAMLGDNHVDTLKTRRAIAVNIFQQGQAAKALKICEEIIPIQKSHQGVEHPETLKTQHVQATILESVRQEKQALETFRLVLEARKRVLGDNHYETIETNQRMTALKSKLDNSGTCCVIS